VADLRRDDRAVAPVVEKVLGTGVALLYIASLMSLLLGGVVPGYQTATGEELGERTLATAAGSIEETTPRVDGHAEATTTVDLPATIDGAAYRLVLENGTLRLDHPDAAIAAERPLALPSNVTTAESAWASGDELVIRVEGPPDNRTLTIGEPT
jgi:hypothetical protein